jgi:hypothetical protein
VWGLSKAGHLNDLLLLEEGDEGVNLKDAGEAVLYFHRSLVATMGIVLD